MPSYQSFSYDKKTLSNISFHIKASQLITLFLAFEQKFTINSQADFSTLNILYPKTVNWHHKFDYLFSLLSTDCTFRKTIADLVLSTPESNTLYNFLHITEFLHKAETSNLELHHLLALLKFLQICANPVQLFLSVNSEVLVSEFTSVLNKLLNIASFCPPILHRSLSRLYEESMQLQHAYDITNSVIRSEREFSTDIALDLPFIMYAFGHQCFYPDLIEKYNFSHKTFIPINVDPNYVANRPLLESQLSSYSHMHLVSLEQYPPFLFRGYSTRSILSLLLSPQNPSPYITNPLSESIVNTNSAYVNQGFNHSLSTLCLAKPSTFDTSDSIRNFVHSNSFFVCISWRSNVFKNENSAFNSHRNSDPSSIITALKFYAFSVNYPIVILNSVNMLPQNLLSELPPNVIYFSDFSSLSPYDYTYLISNSSCYMTGPSGALYVANLFNIPTLVFDFPPFFLSTRNYFCFYHRSKFDENKSVGLSNISDPYILPHNGLLLDKMNITVLPLSSSELMSSFLIFSSVVEQFHLQKLSDTHCIIEYILKFLPRNSSIIHSRETDI